MQKTISLQSAVTEEQAGLRFDQAAAQAFNDYSRARLTTWIKAGDLTLSGKVMPPRTTVQVGQKIELNAALEINTTWAAQSLELEIIFEDEHLLIINKPAGLVVHPGAGNTHSTLANALLAHCPDIAHVPRAGIVHRLDKDTSGLLVVAKTVPAQTSLVSQLQERTVSREYETIVYGEMVAGRTIETEMGRHPKQRTKMAVLPEGFGKRATTHIRLIDKAQGFTYLKVKLETGRTHQIRVHLSHINYPLVGDKVYGGRPRLPKGLTEAARAAIISFPRQALHARHLSFMHPATEEAVSFEVPLPEDMADLLKAILD
jgi:23S rRNA pseudouridine1911/1915/1917 synthase